MSQTKVQLVSNVVGNVSGGVSFTGIVTANSANIGNTVEINSNGINVIGVVTATSLSLGGVTVSSAGLGIATAAGIVGTGVTLLDFRNSGISTVTVSSGIATLEITGGGGSSGINAIEYFFS